MGQRTFILVKKTDIKGNTDIRCIHYQWGYGKTMPCQLIKEVIKLNYDRIEFKDSFIFNDDENYLYDIKSLGTGIDVFDKETVQKVSDFTDNNNGCMVVEVTQTNEHEVSIKIGFMLGYEDSKEPFTKFVSASDYMLITGGRAMCPLVFRHSFDDFCKSFEIKIVD